MKGKLTAYLSSFFIKDFGLKVASVIVAFALWYLVVGQSKMERVFEVSITFLGLKENLIIMNAPKTVQVTVRGPAQIVRAMKPEDLWINIDLSKYEPGERIVPLSPKMVQTQVSGVQITYISPPQLKIQIDSLIEKSVPVQPQFVGQLPEGFQITSVRIVPRVVTIRGPSSTADEVAHVVTETIDIHMNRQSFTQEVAVGLTHPKWHVVSPTKVTVYIQIKEIVETLEFKLPIDTEKLPNRWTIRPGETKVIFNVYYTKKERLKPKKIKIIPVLPDTRLRTGTQVDLNVTFPEQWKKWITSVKIEPSKVILIYKRR